MKKKTISEGDCVRVRAWNVLPNFWSRQMMEYCGTIHRVSYERTDGHYNLHGCGDWVFRTVDLIPIEESIHI